MLKRWEPAEQRLGKALELVAADKAEGDAAKALPDRHASLALELAAAQLDAGDAAGADGTLEKELEQAKKLSPALRSRLEDALVVAARAAATDAMQAGGFERALKLLESAEKLGFETSPATMTAVRCELALAATGAGRHDLALGKLKQLGAGTHAKRGQATATCPFPEPADKVALPILAALNEAGDSTSRTLKAMATLEGLRSSARARPSRCSRTRCAGSACAPPPTPTRTARWATPARCWAACARSRARCARPSSRLTWR